MWSSVMVKDHREREGAPGRLAPQEKGKMENGIQDDSISGSVPIHLLSSIPLASAGDVLT